MFQKSVFNFLLLFIFVFAACGKNYTDVEYFDMAKEKFSENK